MKKSLIVITIAWCASLLLLFFGRDNGLAVFLAMACVGLGLWLIFQLWQNSEEKTNWQALANRDELTGLFNRRGLLATPMKAPYALLMLDIDNFKAINDTHGHAAGDAVLKQLAVYLQKNTRHGDVCARWGGDEFIVLLSGANTQSAQAFIRRLNQCVSRAQPRCFYLSFGCTDSRISTDKQQLIDLADAELLQNKPDR